MGCMFRLETNSCEGDDPHNLTEGGNRKRWDIQLTLLSGEGEGLGSSRSWSQEFQPYARDQDNEDAAYLLLLYACYFGDAVFSL
jgi:hypothetical protein